MSVASVLEGPSLLGHPIATELFAATYERGYEAVTVEELIVRAGMRREEFDRSFEGKTELTIKVFGAYTDDFKERAGRVFESIPTWPDNMRAAAYETARWIQENPESVWFGMVGVLGAPDMVLIQREETFMWAVRVIDAGRALAPDPEAVPAAAPLMAVGAIAETLRRQQEGTLEETIVGAVPKMVSAAVRPYLGEEAARRELSIPPPPDLREPETQAD
jgi:AcrR family transcriptional regulator